MEIRKYQRHSIVAVLVFVALVVATMFSVGAVALEYLAPGRVFQSTQAVVGFEGSGTESEPYLIASADDWDALSDCINNGGTDYAGKYFKLTKNISVSTVLGNRPNDNSDSNDNVFSGTFDGDGHTLSVNINTEGFAAPFAVVHNTTIKNLKVTGTVRSSSNHASGLVAASKPENAFEATYLNIQNVTVNADVSCPSHVAGIVGHAHRANITMENVMFDGSLNASSVQGGFIGWGGISNGVKYNASFEDCIFAGTYKSGAAFYPVAFADGQGTATLINDFYTSSLGSGGNPVAPTGAGQVKLFVATVKKSGDTNYFDNFSTAMSSANWTAGSTLKLFKDISVGSTIYVPSGEHTLDINGHGIRMTGSGSVINVGSGATLDLIDSGIKTYYYDVQNAAANGAGLAMNINKASGTYSFTGGYITGGKAKDGGGVSVIGGTFIQHGGTIIGNYASGNDSRGGGVRIMGQNGSFIMEGGAILANKCDYYGGGIGLGRNSNGGYANEKSTMTIKGGTIQHNWSGKNGGAIHVIGNNNQIGATISGGSIIDNYTVRQATGSEWGGALIATFISVNVSGDPVIKGNICQENPNDLCVNKGIDLSDHLTSGADVGVSLREPSKLSSGDIQVGINSNKDDLKYMHYSGPSQASFVYCDGAKDWIYMDGEYIALAGTRHTHSSGTIWASTVTPPVASVIVGDTTTGYGSLSDALNAWTAGSTLKLIRDVSVSSTVNVSSGAHILDLGGHTIKAGSSGYSVITVGSGSDTIIDDTSNEIGAITGGSVGQNYGGGVTVDGGTLTLKNGAIKGNTNTYNGIGNCGGGIHVRNGGTFIMEGGEISDNSSYVGGGICTDSSATTVSIIGGVIKNNRTQRFGSAIWAGRNGSAVFRVGGNARIIDNISTWTDDKDGEATINFISTLLVSGDPTVHGNWKASGNSAPNTHINLDNVGNSIQVVELEGALTNDTGAPKITITPIYRWNDMANGKSFVFTKNWSKYMGDADPADYFVCGNPAYKVFLNDSGEAEVGTPPVAHIINGGTSAKYGSLSDALNAWTAGSTLKLIKDVSVSSTVNVPYGAHTLDLNGHGIKMTGSGSVITVGNNATLTVEDSAPATEHRFTVSNAKSNGAGLATVNDALTSGYKTFNGGYITGGNAGNGGGIKVNGTANLILNGGTIIGNQASFMGAGIKADNSGDSDNIRVTVNGGAIIYNTVTGYGAGICCDAGVKVTGGTVSYNVASKHPGGVHCHYLTLTGGRIDNNFAGESDFAAGAHADHEVFISGDPVINNNLCNGVPSNLDWDRPEYKHNHMINILGKLSENAKLSVTLRNNGSGTFTSGWKDKMGDADPSKYFVCDVADYEVRLENGEAVANYPFVSGVTASGYTGDYDGTAHSISVSVPSGASVLYGTTEGSYTLSDSPSYTDAGTYTVYYKVSQNKRTPITGSVTVQIDTINATVTVTGNNTKVNYDGTAHTVSGYTAVADTALYDVTKDFTFSGSANVSGTNAGTYNMGLKAGQFANTNGNFATVTFNVTDGYLTVNKINATVTITGHTNIVDYDGKAHSADGYDAVANSDLYEVTEDFTYSGRAEAVRTNAGTTAMGLKAGQFANTNDNFETVTFVVTDGYLKINTVDAVIHTAPTSTNPIYNGSNLSLVTPAEVEGGTVYYAVGYEPKAVPDDSNFTTDIPTAKKTGSYYVWYLVKSDDNHNDLAPVAVRVILAEKDWVELNGTLYNDDGKTTLGDAVVTLMKGDQKVDYVITDKDGNYRFVAPAGVYSIVAEYEQSVHTSTVSLFSDKSQDTTMNGGKTESHLNVTSTDNNILNVSVDGLNEEANSIRNADGVPNDKKVSVLMTVESKTEATAQNAQMISSAAKNKSLIFFDTKVEKTVDITTTVLKETANVLEIAVPYEKVGKRGLAVYSSDGNSVKTFEESSSKKDGTFFADKKNGVVYIYSKSFSTFAIGYTPYYNVSSSAMLGSFKGTATVTITSEDGNVVSNLRNVDIEKINFADIPKGQYTMTVTWIDGIENTLTFPVTIG